MRPTPLVIASILALFGCATPPDGPYIVLRKRPPAPHVIKPGPVKPTTATAAEDGTVPLTPAEKEALFRAFDDYLHESGPEK